jgi:hypothetical protein
MNGDGRVEEDGPSHQQQQMAAAEGLPVANIFSIIFLSSLLFC